MTERQDGRVDRQDDRVEDLEVREDEAREVAGGRKIPNPFRSWRRRKHDAALYPHGHKDSSA